MSDLNAKSKTPAIRFKGFSGEWKENALGVLTQVIDPHPSHRAPEAVLQGVPFIGIGDISEDGKIDYSNVRIVSHHIFDEHRRRYTVNNGDFAFGRVASIGKIIDLSKNILSKYTYSPTMALVKPISIDSDYLKSYLHTEAFKNCVDNKTTGSTRKSLGVQAFRELPVFFPEEKEQTQIGNFFQQLDRLIAQHQQKHDKLLSVKKALLEKMFPKQGETQPAIRFKGFSEPWEEKGIDELFFVTRGNVLAATETKEKKSEDAPYPVYSSQTKNNGLLGFYKEFLFENAITWTTDGANAGTVNYRNGKFYSTNVNGVLISEAGYANKAIAEILNRIAWKHVSHVGNPKLMNNVMSEIKICIPNSIEEQQKIALLLEKIDLLVTKHQNQLTKLGNIKQAMLAKMFV